MKKLTEAAFQQSVIDLAHLLGWRVAHFRPALNDKGQWRTPVAADGKGWPDLFLVRGSTAIAAELKVGRRKTTEEQDAWLEALSNTHILVCVWRPKHWTLIKKTLRDA